MDHEEVWIHAVSNGWLYDVCYLHISNFPGCTPSVMDHAAKHGHLDIINFLYLNRKEGCTNKAFYWASINGHVEVAKTLYRLYPEKCDISNCINNVNLMNFFIKKFFDNSNKCYTCYQKILLKNKSCIKNTCKNCYYIQFPHLKPIISCSQCNDIITTDNYSRIKSKCKKCFNTHKRNYRKQKKAALDYIQFPQIKPNTNCIQCNDIITKDNYSHTKSKCRKCFNIHRRNYRKNKKEKAAVVIN